MVTGTAAVMFTHDRGQTLAPSAEAQQPVAYTYGLAAMLDEPDTLVDQDPTLIYLGVEME